MDRGTAEEGTGVVERNALAKKTLGFVALLSFFSFFCSYFSGYNSNIQFPTLIFSLFGHAMDRKYMFLICNGIVAFLVKNLRLSSSAGFINTAQDSVKQTGQMPPTSLLVQENAHSVEYGITSLAQQEEEDEEMDRQQECQGGEETKAEDESEKEEEEEDDDDEEVGETKAVEGTSASDASVSTEELNHKFEEFIRKMKEEIRIEAQQQLIAV